MRGVSRVAMVVLGIWAGAAQADSKSFERAVPAEPRGVVDISNVSGRIEVIGWDRAEVNVRGELDEGVERVEVTSEHGRTVVKVVLPHTGHHGDAELRVKVPKESEVEVKTVSGEIKLKGHGQPARLHVSSVSGDVRLEHGAGDLEAGTTSGSLVVSLDSARSVRARTTSGDLHFEGKLTRGADLDATSVSGDLKVRASAEAGYSYEARSVSGDITNCFAAQPVERHHGSGHTLEGTRGEGAGHVRLKTLS